MKKRNNEGRVRLNSSILSGALALALGISAFSPSVMLKTTVEDTAAHTEASYIQTKSAIKEYNLSGITTRHLWKLERKTVRIGSRSLAESAAVMNGVLYLPLRAVAEAITDAEVSYDAATKTATLKMKGLQLSATDGGYVTYANSRPLFATSPNVMMSNGRMYIPADSLTKALGIKIIAESDGSVRIAGSYSPLAPASEFYREDEVLWLSKIINAESSGEPLLGQIAVGNVILNRVRSPLYPNTIWSVIFDRKYGVQFSPVLDGSIHNQPSYTAILAAKICLEGTSLSDDTLFFLNPDAAESNWIIKNREYAYTIGDHDFYF